MAYVRNRPYQIRFASNYLFDAGLYFPKISMVTIYFQLLPRHNRPLRWALYFTAAFTLASFFVTIFVDTFWCGVNPAVNWYVPLASLVALLAVLQHTSPLCPVLTSISAGQWNQVLAPPTAQKFCSGLTGRCAS